MVKLYMNFEQITKDIGVIKTWYYWYHWGCFGWLHIHNLLCAFTKNHMI